MIFVTIMMMFVSPPMIFVTITMMFVTPPMIFVSSPMIFVSPPMIFVTITMMFVGPPMIFVSSPMIFVRRPMIVSFVTKSINSWIAWFQFSGALPRRGFIIVEKGSTWPWRRNYKAEKGSKVFCAAKPKHKNWITIQSILEIPLLWRGGEAGVVDTIPI